jgi:hypothetical protein
MPYRRTGAAFTLAAALAAPADPLDPSPPFALAAYGPALAWLRADALVVRGGPPRVVTQRLPRRARQLTLVAEARGRPTAVITGTASNHRAALWRVRPNGKGGIRRVHPHVHGS